MTAPAWIEQFDGDAAGEAPSPYTTVTGEPPAGWRPFSDASPWNTAIASGATATADSTAIVTWLNSVSGGPVDRYIGVGGTTEDFDHPVYFAHAGDPLTRVRLASGARDPSFNGQVKCTPMHNRLMPLPANSPSAAETAGAYTPGKDGHLVIVNGATAYELLHARSWVPGAGMIGAQWGTYTDINGLGIPVGGFGATAADISLLAGRIRLVDLQAGYIPHALAITTKYVRHNVFSYPANGTATPDPGVTAGDSNDLARPVTGARLQLNLSLAAIAALGLPAWKQTILNAMSTFGMIIIDTGGASYGIQIESGAPDVAAGLTDRWATFGAAQGFATSGGFPVLPLAEGVDWSNLRVIA